jgi:cation diffusion facilitator family transporter
MIKESMKQIKRVLWIILFLNLIVAITKLLLGYFTNSSAIFADGVHSLTDGSSNIIALVGVTLAAKPSDDDHPYGHEKYETLTSLAIVGILLFVSYEIVVKAIENFNSPTIIQFEYFHFIFILLTLMINIYVVYYEKKQSKLTKSSLLMADALHTQSDVFISVGVILSMILINFGLPYWIDTVVSLIVVLFIIHAAWEIFKQTSSILVDTAMIDTKIISDHILKHSEIHGVHKIRSRGSLTKFYLDMHLLVEPSMTIEESHKLTHLLEKEVQELLDQDVQVIFHLEPYDATFKD